MCSLGKQGLLELADLCMQKAHYAARQLEKKGLALTFPSPFFNEFVVELPHNALEVRRRLMQQGILSGLPLSVYWPEHSHRMLFAFTEMHSIQQIDQLISQL